MLADRSEASVLAFRPDHIGIFKPKLSALDVFFDLIERQPTAAQPLADYLNVKLYQAIEHVTSEVPSINHTNDQC